jgi:hypothetical protein
MSASVTESISISTRSNDDTRDPFGQNEAVSKRQVKGEYSTRNRDVVHQRVQHFHAMQPKSSQRRQAAAKPLCSNKYILATRLHDHANNTESEAKLQYF